MNNALDCAGGGSDVAARKGWHMNKLLLIILAILLPPLAVYLKTQSAKDTIINILLCIVFWIPGLVHALYFVAR